MSSQWIDFAAIKGSVDIEQVLVHYGVRLKRVRKDYLRGLCPLPTHGSEQSRESFGVDTGRNIWACHSASCCQARHGKVGGNVLDLLACMEACSIREAALRLRAWMDAPGEARPSDQLVSKGKRAGASQKELSRLSFALRLQWHSYLEQRGIRWSTAAWFGAGYYGGSGFLRGRMVFPIHNERGELVAYAGRTMDGQEPRYLFPPGFRKSQVVFNLHRAVESAARQGGVAIVVEGFLTAESASSRLRQRGGFDGSERIGPAGGVAGHIFSKVGSDAGRRRGRVACQPGVGRAVAGRVHGLGAGGLAARPTVERGNRRDSARRKRSMKMAWQFRFG